MHLICFRLIKPYRASIIIWALRWHGRNALWALKCQCLFPVPCRFSNFDPIFRFRSEFPVSIRFSSFDLISKISLEGTRIRYEGNSKMVCGELNNMFVCYSQIRFYFNIGLGNAPWCSCKLYNVTFKTFLNEVVLNSVLYENISRTYIKMSFI